MRGAERIAGVVCAAALFQTASGMGQVVGAAAQPQRKVRRLKQSNKSAPMMQMMRPAATASPRLSVPLAPGRAAAEYRKLQRGDGGAGQAQGWGRCVVCLLFVSVCQKRSVAQPL